MVCIGQFLREVKTCIALKNYSEARYLGPVICTFLFNNFYLIWSLFTTLAFLHAYISLARRVLPTGVNNVIVVGAVVGMMDS